MIAASRKMDGDVEIKIAQVSGAFSALCKAVLIDKNHTLYTKKMVYNASVLCLSTGFSSKFENISLHVQ